jgi:hypothetical protein
MKTYFKSKEEAENAYTDANAYPKEWFVKEYTIPPKPKYRPFKNAEEFAPFRDKWVGGAQLHRVNVYDDCGVVLDDEFIVYDDLLRRTFEGGTPCGLAISEEEK